MPTGRLDMRIVRGKNLTNKEFFSKQVRFSRPGHSNSKYLHLISFAMRDYACFACFSPSSSMD
jgi:hypothetical protein